MSEDHYVTEGAKPIPICPMGRKKEPLDSRVDGDGGNRMDSIKLSPCGHAVNSSPGEIDYGKMLISNLLQALRPPPRPSGIKRLIHEARRAAKWLFGWSARARERMRKRRIQRLASRMSKAMMDTVEAIKEDSANPYFDPEAYEREWKDFISNHKHKEDPVEIEPVGDESVIGGSKSKVGLEKIADDNASVLVNANKARMRSLLAKDSLNKEEQDELKALTSLSGDVVVLD